MSEKVLREMDVTQRIKHIAENAVPNEDESYNKKKAPNGDSGIGIPNLKGYYNESKICKLASMVILQSNSQLTRALEILSGFIVNPDGSEQSELIFEAEVPKIEGDELKISKDEVAEVVDYLKTHFTTKLGIHKNLSKMVFDIISQNGSDVEVYIPGDLTKTLIGNESDAYRSHQVFPDDSTKFDNDYSMGFDGLVHITNDSSSLIADLTFGSMRPDLNTVGTERGRKKKEKKSTGLNIDKIMGARRILKESPLVEVAKSDASSSRYSCMAKHAPSEAIAPVVRGSDPSKALAYYLILDDTGHFIQMNETVDFEQDLRSAQASDKDNQMHGILRNIVSDFGLGKGNSGGNLSATAKTLYEAFSKKLEKQMMDAIKDGSYGDDYRLEDDTHLTEIMFHRVLRKKKTKLILLPASMVSYIAFFYNNAGVGISMVMRAKLLSTLQSVLFYAIYMGHVDQAIPKEKLSVTFDDADTNQQKTKEMILHEYSNSGSEVFQHAASSPAQLMKGLRMQGTQFEYNNTENGDMPNMDIVREALRRERNEINTDFLDILNNQTTQSTGISPQWVSDSYTANFRAEIVRDNKLVRRQIMGYTDKLCEGLTDRVIKRTLNDPVLVENCLTLLTGKGENAESQAMLKLERIMMHFSVTLPQLPDSGMELNKEITENHSRMLDIFIDSIIGDGVIDGVEEMDSRKIESLRANLKAHFMIEFIKENTMFREIADSLSDEDKLKEIVKIEGNRQKFTIMAAAEMAKYSLRADKKGKRKLDKVRDDDGAEEEEPQPTTTSEPEETDLPEEEGLEEPEAPTDEPTTSDQDDVEPPGDDLGELPELPDEE